MVGGVGELLNLLGVEEFEEPAPFAHYGVEAGDAAPDAEKTRAQQQEGRLPWDAIWRSPHNGFVRRVWNEGRHFQQKGAAEIIEF